MKVKSRVQTGLNLRDEFIGAAYSTASSIVIVMNSEPAAGWSALSTATTFLQSIKGVLVAEDQPEPEPGPVPIHTDRYVSDVRAILNTMQLDSVCLDCDAFV